MRILKPLLASMILAGAAWAEDLGPFASTEAAPVAPECRAPKMIQINPATACGKKVYLVAWSDGMNSGGRDSSDIYCARVELKTGKTLDPRGILVCKADFDQGFPAVASDGNGNFLVVWQDLRNGKDYDVYAARVNEDGKVLDPDGFAVSARKDSNEARPAAGYAAGTFLVAWMDARRYPVYGLWGARVSEAGKCQDAEGIELDSESKAAIDKVMPKDGKWLGDKEYWWYPLCSRVTPAIASDGKKCLVAYKREVVSGGGNGASATVLTVDPGAGKISGTPVVFKGSGSYDRPALTSTDKGWALGLDHWIGGWGCTPTLSCARLDAGLKPLDSFEIRQGGKQEEYNAPTEPLKDPAYAAGKGQTCPFQPAAAWNGRHVVLAMEFGWRGQKDDTGTRTAILINRCDPEGPAKLVDAASVRVDTSEDKKGLAVGNPALAAGPDGECLLVYEKDAGLEDCKIVARVIREK
ncbi:MAG: hypothetical protein C0404_05905 [Verrucomicrobia bacterium]|nr:hypothetical protein [Verrucomicrobiota bacterium]